MVLRAGVIGLGVGKSHVSAYHRAQGVELAAVADLNPEVLAKFSSASVKGYSSGEDMLEREPLDIVSICTPPKHHADLTVRATERGIDVLCEKPMAPNLGDCDRMIESASRAGRKLMIGFKKRFEPAYNLLKEAFKGGFDLPYMSHYTYVCTGGVRKAWFWEEKDGGGPIVENTCHAVDILRYLLGDVDRVYAEADNSLAREAGIQQIDSAVFTLRFRNRCMAGVCAGAWARGPLKGERLIMYSKRGIAEISGEFERPRLLRIAPYEGGGEQRHDIEDADPFRDEVQHFVECVRCDLDPVATGMDGRKALEVTLAVKESARTCRPVSIGSPH